MEKIGTNRRLLDKNVLFDFVKPFNLIPEFKAKIGKISERSPASAGLSEPLNRLKKSESFVWSDLLNAGRTYFEQNPLDFAD